MKRLTDEQMVAERERLEHPTLRDRIVGTRCPRCGYPAANCSCSSTKNEHGYFPVEKTELACLRSIDAKLGTIKSIAIFWCVAVPILCVVIGMIVH